MNLSNLTTGGWVLFALALAADLYFIAQLAVVLRHRPSKSITIDALWPAVLTVWFLYLVTP